jgi:hypothetical protein
MVIHRRISFDVPVSDPATDAVKLKSHCHQTKPGKISGFLWRQTRRQRIQHRFAADIPPLPNPLQPPYVDVEASFWVAQPARPGVCDTFIKISSHMLLVTSYYDVRLEPNPNLERDFPLIPWRGEIAMLFVGKNKHYLSRGPPTSVVEQALRV